MIEVQTDEAPLQALPDPTPEMLESVEFDAVWETIKSWDINVPGAYRGYMGATGNHARAILDGLLARGIRFTTEEERDSR